MGGETQDREQIKACKNYIEKLEYRKGRAEYIANRYREIMVEGSKEKELHTVESWFGELACIVSRYGRMLDAVLLEHGINLLWYQQEINVYLIEHRMISDLSVYLGNQEIVKKYISEAEPRIHAGNSRGVSDARAAEPTKPRGRQTRGLKDYMTGDMDGSRLERLKAVMSGRKGKEAALVIRVAISMGWMAKPTFNAVANEFGDVGNKSGYNRYMGNTLAYTKEEIKGMKAELERRQEGGK